MINSSFDASGQFAWDATSLTLFSACPRKYYYRMVEGIVPRSTSVHLWFGGLYATALEHFYKHRANGATTADALRLVVAEALISSWDHERDDSGDRIPGTGSAMTFSDSNKSRFSLIRTLVWYIEEFGDESPDSPQTYHLADGTPAVELSFSLELGDYLWCGHLDRVVNFGGSLYWMDQKTTGSIVTGKFFDDFTPGDQFSGYTWAGQTILKSPVRAGIVDAAQIAVGFTRFTRGFVTRSRRQLEEWEQNTKQIIQSARQAYVDNAWPMHTPSCGNYGGCPYRRLCAQSPEVRSHYIESDFAVANVWNPLEAR